jgi:hypothetical protein
MIERSLEELSRYMRLEQIKQSMKSIENMLIQATLDSTSPYHAEMPVAKDGQWFKLKYGNILYIIQDLIVSPLAESVVSQLTLPENKPVSKYHLIVGNNATNLYRPNKSLFRPKLDNDLQISLSNISIDIIEKVNALVREDRNDKESFPIARIGKRLKGVSIDAIIWGMIGNDLEELAIHYLSEKYGYIAHSRYFERPEVTSVSEFQGNQDTLTSNGLECIRPILGIVTSYKSKREEYTYPKIQEFELGKEGKGVVSRISDKLVADITSKVEELMHSSPETGSMSEGNLNWSSYIRDRYFTTKFERDLTSWMCGTYYEKEGIAVTPVNRVLVAERSIPLLKSYISDPDMAILANETLAVIREYLDRPYKNEETLQFSDRFGSYPAIFKDSMHPLVPAETARLNNLGHLLAGLFQREILRTLPYPKSPLYGSIKAAGQPFIEGDMDIVWRYQKTRSKIKN